MTLILVTLTHRGAVLASDRRTMYHNSKTGNDLALSDRAEKVLVGRNIAIAVVGDNHDSRKTGRDIIAEWLAKIYDSNRPFTEELNRLYHEHFTQDAFGGFVAITYADNEAIVGFTTKTEGLQFQSVADQGKAKLKFFGDGNQIAGDLVDLAKPPLEAFELSDIVNFCAFIIQSAHTVMRYRLVGTPTVGHDVMAAVADWSGASLVRGVGYQFDFPVSQN